MATIPNSWTLLSPQGGWSSLTGAFVAPGDYVSGINSFPLPSGRSGQFTTLDPYDTIVFMVYGSLIDESVRLRGTARIRIYGVNGVPNQAETEMTAMLLCEIHVRLGLGLAGNSSAFGTGSQFADTIRVDVDNTLFPGARVMGGSADSMAQLLLDGAGFQHYLVEVSTDGEDLRADAIGVAYRVLTDEAP